MPNVDSAHGRAPEATRRDGRRAEDRAHAECLWDEIQDFSAKVCLDMETSLILLDLIGMFSSQLSLVVWFFWLFMTWKLEELSHGSSEFQASLSSRRKGPQADLEPELPRWSMNKKWKQTERRSYGVKKWRPTKLWRCLKKCSLFPWKLLVPMYLCSWTCELHHCSILGLVRPKLPISFWCLHWSDQEISRVSTTPCPCMIFVSESSILKGPQILEMKPSFTKVFSTKKT